MEHYKRDVLEHESILYHIQEQAEWEEQNELADRISREFSEE